MTYLARKDNCSQNNTEILSFNRESIRPRKYRAVHEELGCNYVV